MTEVEQMEKLLQTVAAWKQEQAAFHNDMEACCKRLFGELGMINVRLDQFERFVNTLAAMVNEGGQQK
jgi:hypothetical protein